MQGHAESQGQRIHRAMLLIAEARTENGHFCIAVVGYEGWSKDPDSAARYALAVTFEVVDQELAIYEPLKAAIEALEAESGIELEAETEIEE